MALDEDSFRRLVRARDAIHERYAEALRLEDLAREASLSPFHFLRMWFSLVQRPR
jgi:AraC-like DNA-binding protein